MFIIWVMSNTACWIKKCKNQKKWNFPGSWGEPSGNLGFPIALTVHWIYSPSQSNSGTDCWPCHKNIRMVKVWQQDVILCRNRMNFIYMCHNLYRFCCYCLCMKLTKDSSLMSWFSPFSVSFNFDDSNFRKKNSTKKTVLLEYFLLGSQWMWGNPFLSITFQNHGQSWKHIGYHYKYEQFALLLLSGMLW